MKRAIADFIFSEKAIIITTLYYLRFNRYFIFSIEGILCLTNNNCLSLEEMSVVRSYFHDLKKVYSSINK